MTGNKQNHFTFTGGDRKDGSLYSLRVEAALEELDRAAGREYVPMDLFIDTRTLQEHFQASSIRARRTGVTPAAA